MSDIQLDEIRSGYNLSKINSNFEKLEEANNNTVLHRDGGNNTMLQDIDLNSNKIINAGAPETDYDLVRGVDVVEIAKKIKGASFVTQTEQEVPTVGLFNGARWYIIDNNETFSYVIEDGESVGQWVQEGVYGDDKSVILSNTIDLDNVLSVINAIDKFTGKRVMNTDTNKQVYAGGSLAIDVWYDALGAVEHSPS